MKIAITGGAGFIGSHLARAYLDAGHDVLVIDTLVNGSRSAIDARARFYQIDIRDGKLQKLLQQERPDILSHHALQREHAALALEELSMADADVHVRGLLNVLDSCVGASVAKIIFASGGNSLYNQLDPVRVAHAEDHQAPLADSPGLVPIKEDAPLCPQRPYDISKVAGEWYVRYYTRQYGLAHTILRYADVYGGPSGGPESHFAQHPLNYFVHMLLEGQRPTIRGAADEVRDHIYIDDVISANICSLERGKNQTLHISSGQGYTLKDLYAAVAQALESQVEPVFISNSLVEAVSCVLDNTLARHILGWRPSIDLTTGVQRTIVGAAPAAQLIAPSGTAPDAPRPLLVGAR